MISLDPWDTDVDQSIIIVGLGNELLSDDGVGIHAVRRLATDPPPGTVVLEVGTAVLDVLPMLHGAGLVIGLDAIAAGGTPGTVLALSDEDAYHVVRPTSLHEVSLIEAVQLDRELRDSPPRVILIGIEPGVIDYGLDLSPPVARALPKLIRVVQDFVSYWHEHSATQQEETTRQLLEGFHDARFVLEPAE